VITVGGPTELSGSDIGGESRGLAHVDEFACRIAQPFAGKSGSQLDLFELISHDHHKRWADTFAEQQR
jgi:hypothetical protein